MMCDPSPTQWELILFPWRVRIISEEKNIPFMQLKPELEELTKCKELGLYRKYVWEARHTWPGALIWALLLKNPQKAVLGPAELLKGCMWFVNHDTPNQEKMFTRHWMSIEQEGFIGGGGLFCFSGEAQSFFYVLYYKLWTRRAETFYLFSELQKMQTFTSQKNVSSWCVLRIFKDELVSSFFCSQKFGNSIPWDCIF